MAGSNSSVVQTSVGPPVILKWSRFGLHEGDTEPFTPFQVKIGSKYNPVIGYSDATALLISFKLWYSHPWSNFHALSDHDTQGLARSKTPTIRHTTATER